MQVSVYTSPTNLRITSVANPHRDLADAELMRLLTPLFKSSTSVLAINQSERLVLVKDCDGKLSAFSYCASHVNQATPTHYLHKLEHYLLGATHHTMRDFKTLFANKPVGTLKRFTSATEQLYVTVTRVGKRRKMIDEVGNVFVKALNEYFKFPEQIEY